MATTLMRSKDTRKPHPVLVRLPAELYERVEAMANDEFIPPAIIVRRLVAERLREMGESRNG